MVEKFDHKKKRSIIHLIVILLFILTTVSTQSEDIVSAQSDAQLTVTFIDVGQGDSSLLSTNSGIDILIDGGSRLASKPTLTYLNDRGITDLDVVVISHLHEDHYGGLVDVFQSTITVGTVLYNGSTCPPDADTCLELWQEMADRGITPVAVEAGDSFLWGPISATVLNPQNPLVADENENSVVMDVGFGVSSIFFTGDIGFPTEDIMIGQGVLGPADILKVAHHGSKYSTGVDFLNITTPAYAVISVGNNSYGHPGAETLERLDNAGAIIYRTDLDGNVVFYFDESGFVVLDEYQYLPLFKYGSGGSQTPNPMPGENVQCSTVDDAEICASVSNASPTQNSDVTVYGRLVINGVSQPGLGMQTTWYYKSTTAHCDSGITDSGGLAECTRSIGRASIGYKVNIDVSIGGYSVTTSFTPIE